MESTCRIAEYLQRFSTTFKKVDERRGFQGSDFASASRAAASGTASLYHYSAIMQLYLVFLPYQNSKVTAIN